MHVREKWIRFCLVSAVTLHLEYFICNTFNTPSNLFAEISGPVFTVPDREGLLWCEAGVTVQQRLG